MTSPEDADNHNERTESEVEQAASPVRCCSCLYLNIALVYAVAVIAAVLAQTHGAGDRLVLGITVAAGIAVLVLLVAAVVGAREARRRAADLPVLEVALEPDAEESPEPGRGPARGILGTCPYCQSDIMLRAPRVICPECRTPHHRECWRENGGCTTYGCREGPQE